MGRAQVCLDIVGLNSQVGFGGALRCSAAGSILEDVAGNLFIN